MIRFPIHLFVLTLIAFPLAVASPAWGAATPLDRIAVVVNDGVILESEIDTAMAQASEQIRLRNIAPPPEDVLRQQVLERLITVRVQTQRADMAGIKIDDRELNEVLTNIARQNNMSLGEFAEMLRRDGTDYLAVREQLRDELRIERLRAQEVDNRVTVTDNDVAIFLEQRAARGDSDARYRLAHILVGLPDGVSPEQRDAARAEIEALRTRIVDGGEDFASVALAESDGQQALQGGDLGMRPADALPAAFAEAAEQLAPGEVSPVIEAGGGLHLIQLIESQGGDQRQEVTETRSRHLLIQTSTIRSDDQARKLAYDLHGRIKEGETIAELAEEYSDDPGSKHQGGDLGFVPPGALVPEFESRATAMAPGEVSEPFRSQFGWHIVEVVDRRTRDVTDQAREARARNALRSRRAGEEYDAWLRRLRAEAYVEYRVDGDAPDASS